MDPACIVTSASPPPLLLGKIAAGVAREVFIK